MQKIVVLFVFIIVFNTAYAESNNAYNIESYVEEEFQYCTGKNPVTKYDYSKLSDEEKLNNTLLYYFKLINIYPSMYDDGTPGCVVYFDSFQNYLIKSLESIKDKNIKNSKKYHYAFIIYHILKDGLYEYDKIMEHIKYLGNISLKEINSFYKEKLDEISYGIIKNNYKVINFLKNNSNINDDLKAALFYEKIISENMTLEFMFDPDQNIGFESQARKFDIFNSKTNIYSSTDVQGSGQYTALVMYLDELDNDILEKFVNTFSKSNKIKKPYINESYSDNLLFISNNEKCYSQDKIFIFPFMERVYVVKPYPLSYKLYDMYLFTLDNLSQNCQDHIFIANSEDSIKPNPYFSKISSSSALNIKEIPKEEVFKNADKSTFIKDIKALLSKETDNQAYEKAVNEYRASYTDYMYQQIYTNMDRVGMPGQHYLVPSKFYKFDIDNNGKDELLAEFHVISTTVGDSGTYTFILNEKTLELEDNKLNRFLTIYIRHEDEITNKESYNNIFPNEKIKSKINKDDLGKGVVQNFYQKIYTENGKNKIALIEDSAYGIYIDILYEKDTLKVNADKIYQYISNPKLIWKGKVENGRAVDLLNTNTSFDMNKAATLSEKVIVNDVNLRMLDRLSSDKYFKSIKNAKNEEKNRLLNEKRQMNKSIKNCNGDTKCIKNILYADVFK